MHLLQWSKQYIGNHKKEINSHLNQLYELQKANNGHLIEPIKQLQEKVDSLLEEEQIKCKQRATQQ